MSIARTYSAQLIGLEANIVTIEIDISHGLHAFSIVGLGDRSVGEAKDRISAAIKNSGFVSPKQKNQKVVISLAPADMRKEGPSFDLAMAMSYLLAAGDIKFDSSSVIFLGELSLQGDIRKVTGVLPILCQVSNHGYKTAYVPMDNAKEASLARNIDIYAVSSLKEVVEHMTGSLYLEKIALSKGPYPSQMDEMDLSAIRGNEIAKRGLMIAAAGSHNVLMCGPPGTGKTLLAKSILSLLPDLSFDQSIEVTSIHSVARTLSDEFLIRPPFRSPHHTASYPAIIGGGSIPKPGEITLAHRGVLFLDEFPEFDRNVLEALRQPLEDRTVTISRVKGTLTFPAQCILVAAMNPCPCGKGKSGGCQCPNKVIESYIRHISGPILDRIDILLTVEKIDYKKLGALEDEGSEVSTDGPRVLVERARHRQKLRFESLNINKNFNSEISSKELDRVIKITKNAREVLISMAEKLSLSGRAFHRVMKVAQTIADVDGYTIITEKHILEAIQYRVKSVF